MITAFQSNAFQKSPLAFQIASTVVIDTHDGDTSKRDDAFRRRNEALRAMVTHAFEAEVEIPVFAAIRAEAGSADADLSAKTDHLLKLYQPYLDELQEQEDEENLMVLH